MSLYEAPATNSGHLATPIDKTHSRSGSSYSGNYSFINMYDCPSPGSLHVVDPAVESDLEDLHLTEEPSSAKRLGEVAEVDEGDDGDQGEGQEADEDSSVKESDTSDSKDGTIVGSETSGTNAGSQVSATMVGSSSVLSLARNSNISVSTRTSSIPSDPTSSILDISDQAVHNQILKSQFDRYGFKKPSSEGSNGASGEKYNAWFKDYSRYLERNKKKWQALMKNNGLGEVESHTKPPNRFPPKSDKVKKLIRKGIPAEWRGNAWFFYAGGHEKLNKHTGIYEQIVRDTEGAHNKDTEVIERDLNRTFPDNIYFNKLLETKNLKDSQLNLNANKEETQSIKSLRRVLVAFAHYQPHIGYCQSLNFLAGLLLLFMREERCFWMLVILTERIIPKVHSANLEGVHIDQGVLMLCIKEYIPQLWGILGKNFEGETLSEDKILTRLPPVTLVTSSWFMSVFVGNLPIETTLRVWDILWYEGSKSIFRISLTICKMCLEDTAFNTRGNVGSGAEIDQIELFQFMQNYPKTIIDPNILIDNCFKKIGGYGFGSLSQDEINKCREFVGKQRAKLTNKKHSVMKAEMSDEERRALESSGFDGEIHDVYGFHRSIMSGVAWNKNISNRMKKKWKK